MGVALLPDYVAGEDIKAGRLLRLAAEPYVSPKLTTSSAFEEKRGSPAMQTFIAWLQQQGASE